MLREIHIKLAQSYWKETLTPTDNVIDATCGNGKDTLFLAKLVPKGKIFCFDIQKKAIENTTNFLKKNLNTTTINFNEIFFINTSHENFSSIPQNTQIKLIVYNLGYLPGENKEITTQTSSTIKSINNALNLISENGAISIMCYPGHKEGLNEEKAITNMLKKLPAKYNLFYYKNRQNIKAPSFLGIKKKPTNK